MLSLPAATQGPAGQSETAPDAGMIEGRIYTNQFFRFRLTIPEKWAVSPVGTLKQALDRGKEQLKTGDSSAERMKRSADRTVQLLLVSESPLGTVVVNPMLVCAAERLPEGSSVTNGAQYLASMSRTFPNAGVKITLVKEAYPQMIDGVEFSAMDANLSAGNVQSFRRYYAYVQKGYALVFIITPFTDENLKKLTDVMNSIKFQH